MKIKKLPPATINDLLCDKNNNPYFYKNTKKLPYLISPKTINHPIYIKDNISTSLAWDTEYTQPLGNLNKLTKEKLAKNKNKQLIQLLNIDKVLQATEFKSIFDLAKMKRGEIVDFSIIKPLENLKQQPTLQLTTQFKHILYNDAEILLNPKIKNFYEKHVTEPEYHYPYYKNDGCHFIDFLKLKGFNDISIKRFSEKQDFLNAQQNLPNTIKKKVPTLPTLTIKLFGFYSIADLCKSFSGEYLQDILQAIKIKKITLKRRLTASGWHSAWYPNWIISFNDMQYRLAIDFVDIGGIHGIVGYEEVLKNLNMETSDKNLLSDVKDNMLYAMITRLVDFKKYAIGDLNQYEVLEKHNELLQSIYSELGVSDKFTESKLTTGAYTNDLQEAVLFKELNLTAYEKNMLSVEYSKNRKTTKKLTNKDFLKMFTYTASPQAMKTYCNVHLQNNANLTKHTASKTMGGRCNNNRTTKLTIKDDMFGICDIDISGAYSTIYNSLNYCFGSPVILNFIRTKVSIREFLKYYKKNLVDRGLKITVETKINHPLTTEQDLFCSWTNLTYKHKTEKINGLDDEEHRLTWVNLDATNNDIFTTELHNATLTWDDIDWLLNECKKAQREELLDNLYMVSAIFYPARMQCNSIEELKQKTLEHNKNGKGTFNDAMPHSSLDHESISECNYWYAKNFGEIIGDIIKLARARHKKSNKSLSYLFKLIANTLYGINVSQYFHTSNLVLAANITAMCRVGMWYVEKALNLYQTITDGGIFELNKVVHLIYNKIDTSFLVRAYQSNSRELSRNNKWDTKSITKNGKDIIYIKDKGWLIDGVYYGCDVNDLLQAEKRFKELSLIESENSLILLEAKKTFENYQKEMQKLFKKINDLSMEHVQSIWSKNQLLNDMYKHYKTDDSGDIMFNDDNQPIYEMRKGLFIFEVKTIAKEASFHGAADYSYTDYMSVKKTKMRGYESKKSTVAWSLDENNNLMYDENYYKETLAIEMFLQDIQDNPSKVRILRPFTKPSMLKINQYNSQFKKTFRHNPSLIPGNDYYEVVMLPILTMRFKFKTLQQKQNWVRYTTSLKNRYGGLSFEIFYMNDDGTCNYQKMINEIDKHISDGVLNPKKIYDPHNNLKRDYNNPYVKKHVELMRQLKNLFRILIVGVEQYCKENFKILDVVTKNIIQPSKPSYMHSENYLNYGNTNKYSDVSEYLNHAS